MNTSIARRALVVGAAALAGVIPLATRPAEPRRRDRSRNNGQPGAQGAPPDMVKHRGEVAEVTKTNRGLRIGIAGRLWSEKDFKNVRGGKFVLHELPFDDPRTPTEMAKALIDATGGVYQLFPLEATSGRSGALGGGTGDRDDRDGRDEKLTQERHHH